MCSMKCRDADSGAFAGTGAHHRHGIFLNPYNPGLCKKKLVMCKKKLGEYA